MLNQSLRTLKVMNMIYCWLVAVIKLWWVGMLIELFLSWDKGQEDKGILELICSDRLLQELMLEWQLKETIVFWWLKLSKICFPSTWKIQILSTMVNSSRLKTKMNCFVSRPWVFFSKWLKNSSLIVWLTRWLLWRGMEHQIMIFWCLKQVIKFKSWLWLMVKN